MYIPAKPVVTGLISGNPHSSKLVEWVEVNGSALNIKKSKFMIFSRQNSERELPALLIISGKKNEHVREARFLGGIVDENMT